jgi:segregation and condensation protein A
MDYVVKTEVFEGPFDLLLHLIARQRVDIWQVSLSRITEDYLAEVRRMRELNLEVATEFLVVAATLLELKAARLLPAPDADPDEIEAVLEERDLLFARVLQYRAYKQAAGLFGARLAEQTAYVPRRVGAEDLLGRIVPELLVGVSPQELARLAAAALAPAPPAQVGTAHIAPPRLSVAEAVASLARRLQDQGSSSFEDLVGHQAVPIEVVIGLLAVLELYKRSLVELDQTATFGDISIRWTGGDLAGPIDMTVIDMTVEEPA